MQQVSDDRSHIGLQWPVSTTRTVLSPWLRASQVKHVLGGKIVVDLKVWQLEVISQRPLLKEDLSSALLWLPQTEMVKLKDGERYTKLILTKIR